MGGLTTRVAVAAESAVERAGLVALLAGSPTVTVVHTSERVRDIEAVVAGHDIDVAVVAITAPQDLVLPVDLGADLAHRVPALVVLVDEAARAQQSGAPWLATVFANGVSAVLPRDVSADELHGAVLSAANGLFTLTRADYAALALGTRAVRAVVGNAESLTPRESEILGMLADGLANKEIAAQLQISSHTVKTHVQSLFVKLGADSRAEAVALGVRRGLIHL